MERGAEQGERHGPERDAETIKRFEREMDFGRAVNPGPADYMIWTKAGTGVDSISEVMERHGVRWEKCTKDRINGLALLLERLAGARPVPGALREAKGIFFCQRCEHALRTLPTLPRDRRDEDKADSEAEGHLFDAVSYMLMARDLRIAFRDFW